MKKIIDGAAEWIGHNRFTAATLALILVAAVFLVGCPAKTPSPMDPTRDVTRSELAAEVAHIQGNLAEAGAAIDAKIAAYNLAIDDANAKVAAAYDALEEAEAKRQQIAAFVLSSIKTVASGTAPTTGAGFAAWGLAGLAVLGVGATADNIRKRAVISVTKAENKKLLSRKA